MTYEERKKKIEQTIADGTQAYRELQKSLGASIFAAQGLLTQLEVFEEMFEDSNRPPSNIAESPSVIIDDYTGAVGDENQEGGK